MNDNDKTKIVSHTIAMTRLFCLCAGWLALILWLPWEGSILAKGFMVSVLQMDPGTSAAFWSGVLCLTGIAACVMLPMPLMIHLISAEASVLNERE